MIVSQVLSLIKYWNKSWVCWFSVLWYEVSSFVGFVSYQVCGSQKNEGLQYDVTRIDLCLVVTKALWFYRVSSYDNLLHLIGHCLWCRNTTLMLWSGVTERSCWFKKAGQQRTLLSSYVSTSRSQDEEIYGVLI